MVVAGRPRELLAKFSDLASKNVEIENVVRSKWWPKTPRGFSNKIIEIEPNLKEVGIIMDRIEDKHSKSTKYIITNTKYSSPQPSDVNQEIEQYEYY